jgi:hypothetical protein
MRMIWSICVLLLTMTTASLADSVSVCLQTELKLPTLQEQRTYLEQEPRYGKDWADEYFEVAKRYGDDFIQYQVHYQPEASGSLRSDIKEL